MSRNEGKIENANGPPIDASDILAALALDRKSGDRRRKDAFTRYLAGGEGWESASSLLDGAFAHPGQPEEG